MTQPHDSREEKALGFNNLGVEILEIKEEDTTPAEPNEHLRKRLEERYRKPTADSSAPPRSETK